MPLTRTCLTALASGALLAVAAPAAHAATVPLGSGVVAFRLDARVTRALASFGVKASPVGPALADGRSVVFPLTGGAIDPAAGAGSVLSGGGLQLASGSTTVRLLRPRLTLGGRSSVSVQLAGKRLTAFRLDLSQAKVRRSGIGTGISRVALLLTTPGARALNRAFATTAFRAQGRLGAVGVLAVPDRAVLSGGNTALALAPGTLSALSSLGIQVAPADGAFVRADGSYAFPIASGSLASRTLAGSVEHTGALTLSRGDTQVRLSGLRIDTTAKTLSASIDGAAPTPILDLDLTRPEVSERTQRVDVGPVDATLTSAGATALDQAFATSLFTAGAAFGTASILGQTL